MVTLYLRWRTQFHKWKYLKHIQGIDTFMCPEITLLRLAMGPLDMNTSCSSLWQYVLMFWVMSRYGHPCISNI